MRATTSRLLACVSRRVGSDEPDAELLARFVRLRDAEAFAVVLDRYARLVWAVCRAQLREHADAEDAFQATFLALYRGASSIKRADALAPWLHSAAMRISRKARLAASRRAGRERAAARPDVAPVPADADGESALAALHEEIARLPDDLRAAYLACAVEGRPQAEVARSLGVPLGTLSSRVCRAKQKLRERRGDRAEGFAANVPAGVLLAAKAMAAARFATAPAGGLFLAAGGGAMKMLATAALAAVLALGVGLSAGGDGPGAGLARPAEAKKKPPAEATKAMTPEQIEKDRPEGVVAVRFRVEDVGRLSGAIRAGDVPHRPIRLAAKSGLKDKRSWLAATLVGKALAHVHNLGVAGDETFKGKVVEVRGKVVYGRYPRITTDAGTTVPNDGYPAYDFVVESLDDIKVVE